MVPSEPAEKRQEAPAVLISLAFDTAVVGYNGASCTPANSVLSSIVANLQVSWDYPNQAWKFYEPNDAEGSTLTQFCPNYGGWIKVGQGGTWGG